MPFYQVDDQLPINKKTRKLTAMAESGDPLGIAAIGLWTLAGADSQASMSEGRIARTDILRIILNPSLADQLARLLVDAGLWHTRGHKCGRCGPVAAGSWLFHDWSQFGYGTAEQIKTKRAKSKELKEPAIVAAVWARDCLDPAKPTIAACRYCGTEVRRHDRKSPVRPHLDHVDPTIANGAANIVVACEICNRHKGNRRPEEADMKLLDEPTRTHSKKSVSPSVAGTNQKNQPPNQIRAITDKSNTESVPARTDAGARAGRAGAGQGQGHERGSRPDPDTDQPSAARPRRRRQRRRGGTRTTPDEATERGTEAGPAPRVTVPGQFGSAYHGWSGPPSPVADESTCPEHGLDEPCPRCYRSTGSDT